MDARGLKKFSFIGGRSPSARGMAVLIALLCLLGSFASGLVIGLPLRAHQIVLAAGLIAATLAAGFAITRLVPGFKLSWAYLTSFIAAAGLIAAGMIFHFSTRITFIDTLVFWTAAAYALWMLALTGIGSLPIGPKSMGIALIQPALIWLVLWCAVEMQAAPIVPILLLVVAIFASTIVIFFNEYLFSIMFVGGVSGMNQLSQFLRGVRGEQVDLDVGHKIDALVQYLKFKHGNRETVLLAPWLHCGPLRSVGGGNLSSTCIAKLNNRHGPSYFLHVPCGHEYNPSGDVSKQVLDTIEKGGWSELNASRVVRCGKDGISVAGQRLGDAYLLAFSSLLIDDYDIGIFSALRERHRDKKVLFIDSHLNPPMDVCDYVGAFSGRAADVGALADELIDKLSKEPLSKASIGAAFSKQQSGRDCYTVFAMAVRTEGQRHSTEGQRHSTAIYFASDLNGLSEGELKDVLAAGASLGADDVLPFTTDSHGLVVKSLISRHDLPMDLVASVMKKAVDSIARAEAAYGEARVKGVRVMGSSYYELTTLVNIMTRVMPVLFLVLFIFLAVFLWIS